MQIANLITSIMVVVLAFTMLFMIKNEVTYHQRLKIFQCILKYCNDQIRNGEEPDVAMFDRTEDYDTTLFRIWDWGCKNILPLEDYEKIKKYLEVR